MRQRSTQPQALTAASLRGAVVACVLLSAACGKKAPPAVEPKPPTPVTVVPVTVAPATSVWTIPAALPATRYTSEVTATLQRDSAGRTLEERVETRGIIALQGQRDSLGAFRGTGVIDSFTVRGLEGVLTPGAGETSTSRPVPVLPEVLSNVSFNINLDARSIRISTRPPLANECDRAESGAINMARDLVLRLPRTLSVGRTWQDSTVGFVCRLGIPIVTRTKSTFVIERAENVQGRTELVVRKNTDVTMSGELKSTWRTMSVNATGRGTQTSRVDAQTGVIRGVEGDATLTVKLTDSSRRDGSGAQEIRQTTRTRIALRY